MTLTNDLSELIKVISRNRDTCQHRLTYQQSFELYLNFIYQNML